MTAYLKFLLLVVVVLTSSYVQGATEPPEYPKDIAKRLQQRYDEMTSLKFNFYQDTRGEMTGRPRRGSGWAVFYKKDNISKMRWDYSSPDKQILLNNGTTFSMYFENLQQMIVSSSETLDGDLTYSFFTGQGNLQRDFHIRPADDDFQSEDRADFKVIKLIPLVQHSQVQDIHLWVTTESLIRRIKIRDHFGTITVLNLSDIQPEGLEKITSSEIDALFTFTPPKGTEIITQ